MSVQPPAVVVPRANEAVLDETDLFILKLMSENGGELPRTFFAEKMHDLVKKGAVEPHFEAKQKVHSSAYVYRLTTKAKEGKQP